MPKNILIVVDNFSGGAGNMAQILSNYLLEKSNVKLLLMNYNGAKSRYGFDQNDYKQAIYFNAKNAKKIKYIFSASKFIKKVIKENNIDTVVSFLDNNNTICGLSLFFNKKVNLIVSERSNPLVIQPSNKFWTLLRRIAYKRANVVSVQFDEFKFFDGGRFTKKCIATPNIILPSLIKREYKNEGIIKFVSCARFAKIKRFDLMIKLFSLIHKKNLNTELIICGDGPERSTIERIIEENNLTNCVHLIGNVNDTYSILSSCDIYLMTSLQEGFPNALSEALSTGLPAVVFKCHDGISKLVIDDYNGYCIDEGNIDDFVSKSLYLSNNCKKINIFGKNSIEVSKKYSPENILSIWENLILKEN